MTAFGNRSSAKKKDSESMGQGNEQADISDDVKKLMTRLKEYGIVVLDLMGEYQEGVLRAAQCLVKGCGLDLGRAGLPAKPDTDETAEFEESIMDMVQGKAEIHENGVVTLHQLPEQPNQFVEDDDEDSPEEPAIPAQITDLPSDDDSDWADRDQARKRAYLPDGESFSERILETKQVPIALIHFDLELKYGQTRGWNAKRLKKNMRSLINDPPYAPAAIDSLAKGGACVLIFLIAVYRPFIFCRIRPNFRCCHSLSIVEGHWSIGGPHLAWNHQILHKKQKQHDEHL